MTPPFARTKFTCSLKQTWRVVVRNMRFSTIAANVIVLASLGFYAAPAWSQATALAQYAPGQPDGGMILCRDPALQEYDRDSVRLMKMEPSNRIYEEDTWGFRLADDSLRTVKNLVMEIEFHDEGFGIIRAKRRVDPRFKGRYVGPSRSVSYTRLNTGRYRKALFRFTGGAASPFESDKPDFQITGLQHLRAMRLYDSVPESYWKELKDSIPKDVTPAVELKRPMQIVCSAGVTVLGTPNDLRNSIDMLKELLPLAKGLGFNGVESYVRWDFVEPTPGKFDWSFYDAVVDEIRKYDLKWFPLLIVGSAYTLPQWFFESEENVGFVCLEHNLSNPIQSIWSPYHKKHVVRFLQAFGKHYEPTGCLLGVRLGPSGNYGESQYPAGGNWGYRGEKMHIHIGYWANDEYAHQDFQAFLKEKYGTIDALNRAWDKQYRSFEEIRTVLPYFCRSKRHALDMNTWYTDAMTEWCDWWAAEARKAMPNTVIHQSAGGWGFVESGTDYSAQAKSMAKVNGGIRLTNETDSFHQNFYATRLATTAARLYGVPTGYEPASSHTARGTAGRIFNTTVNNGEHFFTYHGNIFERQSAIDNWLRNFRFFDVRQDPVVDVAVYYPQTMNFLDQGTFRYLYAWGFNPRAREIRNVVEVDYLDDRLITEGFLDRYKVLVFAWGDTVEKDVMDEIDRWVRDGGTVIYPSFPRGNLATVEGDSSTFAGWNAGDTGKGQFHRFRGDMDPPSSYAGFVKSVLSTTQTLSRPTRIALDAQRPDNVFISAQKDGHFLAINYGDTRAVIEYPGMGTVAIEPYMITRIKVD